MESVILKERFYVVYISTVGEHCPDPTSPVYVGEDVDCKFRETLD